MSDTPYVSASRIEQVGGIHRRAHLPLGATAEFGVHGAIKDLFRLSPERELPLPVDYVVAAAGGCMLGTLVGALEVRQVKLAPDAIEARAEGIHELRDGLPVLAEVHVHYTMKIAPGQREVVDRALARHQEKCPTAVSLKGAVAVRWTADIVEA